jgi:hypothetical protein
LINYWQEHTDSHEAARALIAKAISEKLDQVPALKKPVEKIDILNENQEIIDLLVSGFFSELLKSRMMLRLSGPFNTQPFYQSKAIEDLINDEDKEFFFPSDPIDISGQILVFAGNLILNQCYGQPLAVSPSFPISVRHKKSGLEQHFTGEVNSDFVEVTPIKALPKLKAADIGILLKHLDDPERWLRTFPPDHFLFRGIMLTSLLNITRSYSLSQLEKSLLQQHALNEEKKITRLCNHLRSYFSISDLKLGVFAMDYPLTERNESHYRLHQGIIQDDFAENFFQLIRGSIYEQVLESRRPFVIEDIREENTESRLGKAFMQKGYRSLLITPLSSPDGRLIGILEIASLQPAAINQLTSLNIREIAQLFSIAVERSRSEFDNQLEATLKKEFTSIHPSVEWRFEETAMKLVEKQSRDLEKAEVDPIIFKNVYPLYGQADIVSSSHVRNDSIAEDLQENLRLIKNILKQSFEAFPYPGIDEALVEANTLIIDLHQGVSPGNEFHTMEFIRKEIHPLFEMLMEKSRTLAPVIKSYFNKLDPDLGIYYNKRKQYEESVARINKTISFFLDHGQELAQSIIPHFYEKYQTDGVAYNMYVGQSLLREGTFIQDIHLTNLRLWQLQSLCLITQKIRRLQQKLPIPLTTAQLILVHSSPLTIRFRLDEKRFDVDGTYNARYEIVKKRIDKALIAGTNERLTVSDKIAIVFQYEEDKKKYIRHIEYLVHKGLLKPEWEELAIQPLQGVKGLSALRVTVA